MIYGWHQKEESQWVNVEKSEREAKARGKAWDTGGKEELGNREESECQIWIVSRWRQTKAGWFIQDGPWGDKNGETERGSVA